MGCYLTKVLKDKSNTYEKNKNELNSINEEYFYKLKNNYILYSRLKDNKLEIYNSNILSLEELNEFILSKSKLSIITKDKNKLLESQINIYKYKNNLYKFNNFNKSKIYDLLIRKNIKNVLVPKFVYNKFNLFLEIYDYYEEGDLFNYTTENDLSFEDKLSLIKQIIVIIKDLHSINLTHRDIKLENFVIKRVKGIVTPILIDFDYANLTNEKLDFNGGTYAYLPPERLKKKSCNDMKSADIWALGVTIYNILFNQTLWISADYRNDIYYRDYIDYNQYNSNLYWNDFIRNNYNIETDYKDKLIDIFNYCFNLNYSKRNDISYIYNILL